MNRRELLGSAAALSVGALLPRSAGAATPPTTATTFNRLLDRTLSASPIMATLFGLDTGDRAGLKHRLDDRRPTNQLNMYASFLELAPVLAAAPKPSDPRERQWLETAQWFAGAARDMAAFEHLTVNSTTYPCVYALTQLNGAYVEVPDMLATQHSIASSADCDAYIDRLAVLGDAIDQDTEVSRTQAAAGIIPPDFLCDRTSSQLADLAKDVGRNSGLVQALATRATAAGICGDWEREATKLVDGPIKAALERQRAQVAALRSRAGASAGVGARPHGDAFYDMALRFHLTTATSAAEVHRIGSTRSPRRRRKRPR